MAFATIDEYAALYPMDEVDDDVLSAMLDEASDAIEGELDPRGIDYDDPSEKFAGKLRRVCCIIVHRSVSAVTAPGFMLGATQATQTAGPYTLNASYPSGFGTIRVLPSDREKLGIGQGTYVFAEPYCGVSG